MQPKVSVLMPVYNGEVYLEETITSILNQSFADFEFIIIDDSSKDNTWEILIEYAKRDQRIKLYKNKENLGLIKSLNKGLTLAEGDFVARQDADDISLEKRFEKQVEILSNKEKVVLVSCNIEIIDANGSILRQLRRSCESELVPWYLIFHNRIAGHSQVMFRRKQILDLDGYSEVNLYSEDYELWSRLVDIGSVEIIPEALLQRRIHTTSLCATRGNAQLQWSLIQSQFNIKQLIGKEIDLEEVKHLRYFWNPQNGNINDLKNDKFQNINFRLKEIYQAFIMQRQHQDLSNKYLAKQIRRLVSKQFLYLANIKFSNTFTSKVTLYRYSLAWEPVAFISFFVRKCLNAVLVAPLKASVFASTLKYKLKY